MVATLTSTALLIFTLNFCVPSANADEVAPPPTPVTAVPTDLPEIDARKFESTPRRQSKTGRVIVFEVPSDRDLPQPGHLVLLKQNGKSVLALRVLQTDAGKKEYTARKIRRYDHFDALVAGQKFESLEKLNDVIAPLGGENLETPAATPIAGVAPAEAGTTAAPESAANAAPTEIPADATEPPAIDEPQPNSETPDLKTLPYDSDLDKTTSPEEEHLDSRPVDYEDEAIEEIPSFVPYSQAFGIHAGYFLNTSGFSVNPTGGSIASISYSFLLGRGWFAQNQKPQDRALLELAAGYYRLMDFTKINDNYSIAPVRAELRYELDFNPNIALNFYLGFQYNLLAQAIRATKAVARTISGPQATAGTGLTILLGPHWYFRLDAGWDRFTGGLMIQW